jgi:hypothetical protein
VEKEKEERTKFKRHEQVRNEKKKKEKNLVSPKRREGLIAEKGEGKRRVTYL